MKQNDSVNWDWMAGDRMAGDWMNWLANVMRICQSQTFLGNLPTQSSIPSSLLNRHLLLLVSLLILTVGYSSVAQAESPAESLIESMPSSLISSSSLPSDELVAALPTSDMSRESDRLAIPADAIAAPIGSSDRSLETLPPPPLEMAETPQPEIPQPEASQPEIPQPESAPFALLQSIKAESQAQSKAEAAHKPVELAFNLPPAIASAPPSHQPQSLSTADLSTTSLSIAEPTPAITVIPTETPTETPNGTVAEIPLDHLFQGNSESLVARAVGSAEGTRTPEGDRNPAYYGHVDPGNKVWNLGTVLLSAPCHFS
ncbi:MAG: hypothetical protein HC772_18210 [Leptolyngbyaceae cyanobacterium CRU_2_3]|nr:hypothetical protein [Leptolyngbyaceae cyanobacterium CRU_2_3]